MSDPCSGASLINRILFWIARLLYWIAGWRVDGRLLDVPKYVLIAAPHTSNWDAVMAFIGEAILTCGFHSVKIAFFGKDTLFKWPLGPVMRRLGGIPVDRSSSHGLVEQVVQAFRARDRLVIGVTPEGQRKKTAYWKTGFYHMAHGAGVPILLVFIDYRRKVLGTGPTIYPTGDIQADMVPIRAFYRQVTARHPEKVGNMEVPPEHERS